MKRIVDFDPVTGITDTFDYDSETDTVYLGREQEVGHILDLNKRLQNDDDYSKSGIKEEFWHYARIPNVVAEKWLIEDGIDIFNKNHERKVFQKLNSPEYRWLKTTTKRHSI